VYLLVKLIRVVTTHMDKRAILVNISQVVSTTAQDLSPLILLANWISLGMMVTLLA
jgi:hypothetical protein